MAGLSITELLFDTDLCDQVVISRRTKTVDDDGRAADTATTINAVGSVQPASGSQLAQLDDASRTSEVIMLYTATQVRAMTATDYDVLVWHGQDYRITKVNSYGNFGGGYYEATCERLDTQDSTSG